MKLYCYVKHHISPESETVAVIVAATRIQAKYKGYRVKGDYLKQREAGEC